MKTAKLLSILLMIASMSSCNLFESVQKDTPPVSTFTIDSLLLVKRTEATTLSVVLIDDITGSYALRPESRDMDILFSFFGALKGRKLLGYTTITEDSYSPIVRLAYLDVPQKTNSKHNMWKDSEVINFYTEQYLTNIIDSLNGVEVSKFKAEVARKLDRPIARRSDVALALQRASMFLNESPTAKRVMIVCSDFKDTFGRSIRIDPEIQLFIVGHSNPEDIKRFAGREPGTYTLFECYTEAFHRIVQMYN